MPDRASLSPVRCDLRLLALDQLRGFIIVLVVLHHAILAYCTFGHIDRVHYALSTAPIVDTHRWVGFDLVVMLNDGFFMPLLFLLSGLFVPGGLARRTPVQFLRGRLLRLGLPFAVAELTLVPLAYYPSFLQAGGTSGFPAFWTQTITTGPWPSGPPWFIGILLLFDVVAALLFMLPHRARPKATTSGVLQTGSMLCRSADRFDNTVSALAPGRSVRLVGSPSARSRFRSAAFCFTPRILRPAWR